MKALQEVRSHLKEGALYRRHDVAAWSKSVDRHLKELVQEGTLKKLRGGLYYRPRKSVFGEVPADTESLVEAFLKGDRFLLTSFNAFNALGLGTTQLYNHTVVYNYKRHGLFKLGVKTFDFRVRPNFPSRATPEFYVVDMLNNIDALAEDRKAVLASLNKKMETFNKIRLSRLLREFGTLKSRKIMESVKSGEFGE